MRFWRITQPNYEGGDYAQIYINGLLTHPYGLPGIRCDVCQQIWGGSRVLTFECPESLRKKKIFKDRWPVSLEQHEAARAELSSALAKDGIVAPEFRPGDSLQPACLEIPSKPEADFLWPGINGPVVSERVKGAFESWKTRGVSFTQVEMRKVGKRPPVLPAPIPRSGEPEDIIKEVPLLKDSTGISNYYEMIVTTESENPPGGDPISTCVGCGRKEINNDARRIVMLPSMWRGDPIFTVATTLYIMVTEELRLKLENLQPTNIAFSELDHR